MRPLRQFLFQFDGFWEKDIVFKVDVLVQILLELLQQVKSYPVGSAAGVV